MKSVVRAAVVLALSSIACSLETPGDESHAQTGSHRELLSSRFADHLPSVPIAGPDIHAQCTGGQGAAIDTFGVGVKLPANASEGVALRRGEFSFSVVRSGAEGALSCESGAWMFDGARELSFWTARPGEVEELVLKPDGSDGVSPALSYEVRGATVKTREGELVFADALGHAYLGFRAPAAFDEHGRSIATRVEWDSHSIRVYTERVDGPVLVDPIFFRPRGTMMHARSSFTSTLLPDGRVFVTGGTDAAQTNPTTWDDGEVFDPGTGLYTPTANKMSAPRTDHTATMLEDGRVLIAGGGAQSAEFYDPATNSFSSSPIPMRALRRGHSATPLSDGRVFVTGGQSVAIDAGTAEMYFPDAGMFSDVAAPAWNHRYGTATAIRSSLGGEQVLVVAGVSTFATEVYDVETDSWLPSPDRPPNTTSFDMYNVHDFSAHLMPDGGVRVIGGWRGHNYVEQFNPGTRTWTTLGTLNFGRAFSSAALFWDGKIRSVGGRYIGLNFDVPDDAIMEYAEPNGDAGTPLDVKVGTLSPSLLGSTATILPSGHYLLSGDYEGPFINSATNDAWVVDFMQGKDGFSAATPNAPSVQRKGHEATLLADGRVLLTGGVDGSGTPVGNAAIYSETDQDLTELSNGLVDPRTRHATTLLMDGRVLITGGVGVDGGILDTAELFDPSASSFSATGVMGSPRAGHSATLLSDGRVLVAGGESGTQVESSTELFDPSSGTFTPGPSMKGARFDHSATVMPSGEVVVAGGSTGTSVSNKVEVFDGTAWRIGATLGVGRSEALLLAWDKGLLLAGGQTLSGTTASIEAIPAALDGGVSTDGGSLQVARKNGRAVRMPNGKFLILGGNVSGANAELIDPLNAGAESAAIPLNALSTGHTATLLPSGHALLAGGFVPTDLELYQEGRTPIAALMPVLDAHPAPLVRGSSELLTGKVLTGVGDGSGGTGYSSPSSYPIVFLEKENGASRIALSSRDWSPTQVHVTVPATIATGWWWMRPAVNGAMGPAIRVRVALGDGAACTTAAECASGGCVQGTCGPLQMMDAGTADGGATDGGERTDAGEPDAGSQSDAGSTGSNDGGTSEDGGTSTPPGSDLYSCGCGAGGAPDAFAWFAAVAVIAMVARRRARRIGASAISASAIGARTSAARFAARIALTAILVVVPARAFGQSGSATGAQGTAPSPLPSAEGRGMSAAVLTLRPGPGVDASLAEVLTENLSAEIQKLGVTVLTTKDIETKLNFERQKAMLGCSEDVSCMTEIGNALGVDVIVTGSVSKVGNSMLLNVQYLPTKAQVQHYSERARDADALLDLVPRAARAMPNSGAATTAANTSSAAAGVDTSTTATASNGEHGAQVLELGLRAQAAPMTPLHGAVAVHASYVINESLSVGAGALVTRPFGAYARVAFVPLNADGTVRPVIALETPVLFSSSPAIGVGASVGVEWRPTRALAIGAEVPVQYFVVAPEGTQRTWVFGALTAAFRL